MKLRKNKKTKRMTFKKQVKNTVKACHDFIKARDMVRFRGLCWCGCGRPINCAMHVIPAKHPGTRFNERNILGGNSWCNGKDRPGFGNHDYYVNKFIEIFGAELYGELVGLSDPRDENGGRQLVKYSRDDLVRIEVYFQNQQKDISDPYGQ